MIIVASKSKKKTKKLSRWQKLQNTKLGAQSLEEITDSVRTLSNLKITLPLGNPSLKYVHTNQFLWTDLPKEFRLANFGIISKALNGKDSRWSGYEVNRWYIENTTIRNDGTNFDMELDVNPFATSIRDFQDGKKDLEKAYLDNLNKDKNNNQNNNKNDNKTVKSVNSSTLKGGQGKVIDDLVKRIVGNTTDDLAKAKLIHKWLQQEVRYSLYCCAKYKTAEECYNNRKHLNCADTATLTCRMMLSAGLKAYIVHRTHTNGHFWTVIEIGGTKYVSDQTGDGSAWNTVWYAYGNRGSPGSTGGNWDVKNGDFPDCYPAYSCN